jgi:hypothetical protein
VFLDACEVDGRSSSQAPTTLRRDRREKRPAVLGVGLPFDQPRALELGDDSAHALSADHRLSSEFGHAKAPLGGRVGDEQHVVPGERQPDE